MAALSHSRRCRTLKMSAYAKNRTRGAGPLCARSGLMHRNKLEGQGRRDRALLINERRPPLPPLLRKGQDVQKGVRVLPDGLGSIQVSVFHATETSRRFIRASNDGYYIRLEHHQLLAAVRRVCARPGALIKEPHLRVKSPSI